MSHFHNCDKTSDNKTSNLDANKERNKSLGLKNEKLNTFKRAKKVKLPKIKATSNNGNTVFQEKELTTQKFISLIDNILECACSAEEEPSLDISKSLLQNLSLEAAKLKEQNCMSKIDLEKLIQLLNLLKRFILYGSDITPITSTNNNKEENELFDETAMEKVMKAASASLTALYIFTSSGMNSCVYLENTIGQILIFTKYQMHNTVFPVFNVSVDKTKLNSRKKHTKENKRRCILLNQNMIEIIILFSELLQVQKLTDSLILQLSSIGISSFFSGVRGLEFSSFKVLTTIFSKYEKHRKVLIDDIIESVSINKCNLQPYKCRNGVEIKMLTALLLQLVQCVSNFSKNVVNNEPSALDSLLLSKYKTLINISSILIQELFNKVTVNKSDNENYRTIFDNLVCDLLTACNIPEWPATEIMLRIIGNVLTNNLIKKHSEITLRLKFLDYLGHIICHIRKTIILTKELVDNDSIIQKLFKDNVTCSQNNTNKVLTNDEDKLRILQENLLNYLSAKNRNDKLISYARHFYLVVWYNDICSKITTIEPKNNPASNSKNKLIPYDSPTQQNRAVNRNQILEELKKKKVFLMNKINFFEETSSEPQCSQNNMDSEDISKICFYLSSKWPLYQNFQVYLGLIIKSLTENSAQIRARAMKCLTCIIEVDPTIFEQKEIQIAINHSFLDLSALVREAAVDLVGKFIIGQPNLIEKYYDTLTGRILDTGLSVRKRVIKILLDVCTTYPDFSKIPEIYVRIVNRINDEESIRHLVLDVFQKLWFTPFKEKPSFDGDKLVKKVIKITDAIKLSNETSIDYFEKLIYHIFQLKEWRQEVLTASRQIVDCLIEIVIQLEKRSNEHERLASCMILIYLFSKSQPQLLVTYCTILQPYLSRKCTEKADFKILNYVARVMKQTVPLIDHPSESFLARLEEDYVKLIMTQDSVTVSTCVACLADIINKKTKNYKLIRDCFNVYYGFLKKAMIILKRGTEMPTDVKPSLNRSLFVIGLFIQHFDFDSNEIAGDSLPKNIREEVTENIIHLLQINCEFQNNALRALGSICIRYFDLLTQEEIKSFYIEHLTDVKSPVSIKVQILNNIETCFLEEDIQWAKQDEEWKSHSKSETLKEISDIRLGMASTIAQQYLNSILDSTLHSSQLVRAATSKVIQLFIEQGLVQLLKIVPYLICMCTDEDKAIRNISEKLLQEIENKSPGCSQVNALPGLKLSYNLQKALKGNEIVRGYRLNDNSSVPEALNHFLYTLMKNKQQKCSLITSVVRLFDGNTKLNPAYLLYLADNLSCFPYKLQDETLFVIYQIDIMLSISGANMLQMFRENLQPNVTKEEENECTDDDEDEKEEILLGCLPDDVRPLKECINAAQGCLLLGSIKKYLKFNYSINDDRIAHYSPAEKFKLFDKINLRKSETASFHLSSLLEKFPRGTLYPTGDSKSLVKQYLELKNVVENVSIDDSPRKQSTSPSTRFDDNVSNHIKTNDKLLSSVSEKIPLTEENSDNFLGRNINRKSNKKRRKKGKCQDDSGLRKSRRINEKKK